MTFKEENSGGLKPSVPSNGEHGVQHQTLLDLNPSPAAGCDCTSHRYRDLSSLT